MTGRAILVAALGALLATFSSLAKAQEEAPWEHVPETVSPEWGGVFAALGAVRFGPVPAPDDLDAWREGQDARNAEREPDAERIAAAYGVTLRDVTIGGVPVLEVTPNDRVREDKIAVYTHGGAYVFNSARALATSAIIFAAETGLTVMSVDYTLAPHSKWQNTTDEVLAVFAGLAEMGFAGGDIVLYGDSAGGSLAAGSVLKMRDQDMDLPAALILWSPWSDIGEVGDSYFTLRDAEPFYTYADVLGHSALAYAKAEDHKHPYVSPVYGDYTKEFPPTLIQGGTKELFLSNVVRHYQALAQNGQTVVLDLYEGMPHVFQSVLPESEEARAALARSADWVREHLLGNGSGTFSGTITDITRPESIWIGAIEVRLRAPFILDDKREEALAFVRGVAAAGKTATCQMTGEREGQPGAGTLFGRCTVFDPAEGRHVDIGEALIDNGFARPCSEEIAVIAIWPPVFDCQ